MTTVKVGRRHDMASLDCWCEPLVIRSGPFSWNLHNDPLGHAFKLHPDKLNWWMKTLIQRPTVRSVLYIGQPSIN